MRGFENKEEETINLASIKTGWIKKLVSLGISCSKGANKDSLKEVAEKFYDSENKRLKFETISQKVRLVKRMMLAVVKGEYKNVSPFLLVQIGLAFSYFYFDVDFISDKIPVLGSLDDIAVVLWLLDGFKDELEKFEMWEISRSIRLA